eukprot:3752482-Pyramimonas_sp.AAC.1
MAKHRKVARALAASSHRRTSSQTCRAHRSRIAFPAALPPFPPFPPFPCPASDSAYTASDHLEMCGRAGPFCDIFAGNTMLQHLPGCRPTDKGPRAAECAMFLHANAPKWCVV